MAAEFVGGALLSAFLQVAFDRLASHQVVDFFRARKLDETLLGKSKIVLRSIDALADDAEQKQFADLRVQSWLFDVRDAAFDAEDLLDEIDYELARYEAEAEAETESQTFTYEVSNPFNATSNSFNQKIDSGMKQVLDRLENLANQQGALGLKKGAYVGVGSGSKVSQKLPSTSLVVESVIYGRDDDKEKIFNWLTSEIDNRNQLSILSVVGMGGVGKTTLVQHVYNDPRMEEARFDIKAWVCVSDDFDVFRVTRTILEAITKSKDDSGDLEMVHGRLKEKLSGKKFLLVLDDVWNERREEWEAVQTPFRYGAPGSRILVTTRSQKVASNIRSTKVHLLEQLQEDNCWQVFAKHAFQDDNAELKEIGVKIVEKCKGLPLALKSIGSLLYTKSSISEWESVLLSKIWELPKEDSEIIPALLLSYHYLPFHLKRCFAYCALFPKDYEFDKKKLIELWMTENFLQCVQQSKSPEEVGEEYFDYLLSRSFFQQSRRYKTQCFVMHDLLNDLAKYVCGDICFRYGVDEGKCIPKTARHFSFDPREVKYFDGFKSLQDATRLRTFIPVWGLSYSMDRWQSKLWIHEVFSKFKFIRVLSLVRCSELSEVPDSVGDLIHLRSLDLSSTCIRKLPDSICLLYNLQILKMNYCWNLEQLPSNLHKLTKLRCLEFEGTKVTKMPMHFGELKNLQVLSKFFVEKRTKGNIQHLGGLNLHGELSIEELQNIVNPSDALAVDLKSKIHLTDLQLNWDWKHIPDDTRKDEEVLENLHPSKNVRELSIINYGGTQFPSWLFSHALSNMTNLTLGNCKYCLRLPPLGLLPSLKELTIEGLDGIVSIGAEFYGSDSCSFTSLETLQFFNMKEWEEWECKDVFPRLQYLFIRQCPKLKGLSEQLLHVKQLFIRDCGRLIISGHSMEASSLEMIRHTISNNSLEEAVSRSYDFLQTMSMDGRDPLTTFPLDFFPNLRELKLWKCRNLQMISQEHTHNHLKYLSICECPQFESFPSEGLSAPSLESLNIDGLGNLKLLPKCMHILLPSLIELSIGYCPQVEMFSDGGLPSNLERVSLSGFKLISLLKGALGANTCLKSLTIKNVDVESFPDEGSLPLSLTSLTIWNCWNLKKLDYKGLRQLSSLKELSLVHCGSLQCLPEEGLPKSISTLEIINCRLLSKRCQKPEGEDWGKIAHIENLKFLI